MPQHAGPIDPLARLLAGRGQARLLRDITAWGDDIRIAKLEPQ